MRIRRSFVTGVTLALTLSVPSAAQEGRVELGMDAGLIVSINSDVDNTTSVSVPLQRLRVGFFLSDAISLEPTLALNILSGGGETATTIEAGGSILYHLRTDPTESRLYVRGGAGLSYADIGDFSASQFGISGGVGIKTAGDPISLRFEGVIGYNFENDDFVSSVPIGVLAGVSVITG